MYIFLRDVSCKAPKGKMYSKYFNTVKKLQSVGLKVANKTHVDKIIVSRSQNLLECIYEWNQLHYSLGK